METSFFVQNASHFYPFDEELVGANQSKFVSQSSKTGANLLRQGVVDLGVVIVTNDQVQNTITATATLSKSNNIGQVKITINGLAKVEELVFSFALASLNDFETIKASNGANIYGYLTIGFIKSWEQHNTEIKDVPIYVGCIKVVNRRRVSSIEVLNDKRWLPDDPCGTKAISTETCTGIATITDVAEPPDRWTYGKLDLADVVFKAGYNCLLTFSALENKIQITPMPGAGYGAVEHSVRLGNHPITNEPEPWLRRHISTLVYDEELASYRCATVSEPDAETIETIRYDTINLRAKPAVSLAGAWGDNVKLTTDNNFEITTIKKTCDSVGTIIVECLTDGYNNCVIPEISLPECYKTCDVTFNQVELICESCPSGKVFVSCKYDPQKLAPGKLARLRYGTEYSQSELPESVIFRDDEKGIIGTIIDSECDDLEHVLVFAER